MSRALPETVRAVDHDSAGVAGADPLEAVHGKHVLIVAINYWPEATGAAPYTTAVSEYLARGAASVNVIAGLPCYPAWTVPEAYRGKWRFHEEVHGVRLTRIRHFVPRKQDALRRGLYELTFLTHAAVAAIGQTPDIVIGVTPALSGALAAARVAERHDARLVLIVQDVLASAAAQSGIRGGDRVAGVVGRLESWVLRQADAVAVVSDAFRPRLAEYGVTPTRVHTLPNWARGGPPRTERAAVRARLGWADGVLVALHTGNMGLKQDLGNIVEAARLTRSRPDLRWVLMGDGSQRAQLEEQAYGLPNLEFLPLCEEDVYSEILGAADVLLLNERAGVRDMSLPSKLTSYFLSGRPVAGAVPPEGSSARELRRAGAPPPVPPNDPASLLALVLQISDANGVDLGRAPQAYARDHLTRAAAMEKLCALMSPELGSQPPSRSGHHVASDDTQNRSR